MIDRRLQRLACWRRFPDIGFEHIVILVPIEVSDVANGSPRKMRVTLANIVRKPATRFRDDLESARDGVEMQRRTFEGIARQAI
jgi:hypothetical protein